MKKIALLLCILVLPYAAGLGQVSMEQEEGVSIQRAAPEKAVFGQKIWVSFILENTGGTDKEIQLKERLAKAEFEKDKAKHIETAHMEKLYYYEWRIRLKPKEKTIIAYWIIPEELGAHVLLPSETTIGGRTIFLESAAIEVMCRADGICNTKAGENYFTCAEDCATGIKDNVCDFADDGKCDEDCREGADKDCIDSRKPATLREAAGIMLRKVELPPHIKEILKKAIRSRIVGFFVRAAE